MSALFFVLQHLMLWPEPVEGHTFLFTKHRPLDKLVE